MKSETRPRKVLSYMVLSSLANSYNFNEKINELIGVGYEPLGPPIVNEKGVFQGMIKYED